MIKAHSAPGPSTGHAILSKGLLFSFELSYNPLPPLLYQRELDLNKLAGWAAYQSEHLGKNGSIM